MCVYHEAAGLFTIHEAFGNGARTQDLISVTQDQRSVRFPVKKTHCGRQQALDSPHTAGGTPGRRSCWGILAGRFGSPPAHRCTSAAPRPGERPAFQPEKKIFVGLFHLLFIVGYCVTDHSKAEFNLKLRNNAHLPFSRGWG